MVPFDFTIKLTTISSDEIYQKLPDIWHSQTSKEKLRIIIQVLLTRHQVVSKSTHGKFDMQSLEEVNR